MSCAHERLPARPELGPSRRHGGALAELLDDLGLGPLVEGGATSRPLPLRPLQSPSGPLDDEVALELGDRRQHAHGHLSGRAGRVYAAEANQAAATIRCTVLTPMPSSRAILSFPKPCRRSSCTRRSTSSPTVGRPRVLPWARARCSPARTRSTIMALSNSAKTPII